MTPRTAACQASLSSTISWSLLKLMSIESVTLSNHFFLYCPLLLPSIFSRIRIFSNELAVHIRWPKNWTFSSSISPSDEYSVLISFRIDYWLDLLEVQGILRLPWWLRGKASACTVGDPGSIPGSGRSTPALLPGKSRGRRSLIAYSPWGRKESNMTE